MTTVNVTETEELLGAGMHASITVVEETSNLLKSYMQLMFNVLEFRLSDPDEVGRAASQMYALSIAMRGEIDKLLPMPEALMKGLRELRKV